MTYIEITKIPVREPKEDYINPAASIIQRAADQSCLIELRFIKIQEILHCILGMSDELVYSALIELDRTGFRVSTAPKINKLNSEYVIFRNLSSYAQVIPGEAPKFNYDLTKIETSEFKSQSVFALLDSLPDNSGFSILFGSRRALDTALISRIPVESLAEDSTLYQLVHSSAVYPAVICTYAPNSKLAEVIARELCYTYSGMSYEKIPTASVDGDLLNQQFSTPQTRHLSVLHTLYTSYELNKLADMRGLRGKHGIPYNKNTLFVSEYSAALPKAVLTFGNRFDSKEAIGIPMKTVSQHMFIGGAPGTGKGNLLFSLAFQFYQKQIPFLIIESAKSEMHHMRKVINELRVWRPKNGEYVLNPFALPDDVSLEEYRASLISLMRVCFKLEGSLEELFLETLRICFAKHGFHDSSTNTDKDVIPFGINEFMITYRELLEHKGYSARVEIDMKTAGLTRLQSLFNENKPVYDSVHSIPIKEFTNGFNLLQLNSLTTQESKQLFATILLVSLGAWMKLKMRNENNDDLKLVIILDESHNLLKGVSNSRGDAFSFSNDFLALLLEMRSLGIGFIIADQSCNNLPMDMAAACATKVFLGGSRYSGIENFKSEFGMDELSLSNLYLLSKGEGCMYTYGMPSAVPFKTPHIIDKFNVNEAYPVFNDYLKKNPRYTIETFQECLKCPKRGACTLDDKTKAASISEMIYSELGYLCKNMVSENDSTQKKVIQNKIINQLVKTTAPYDDVLLRCSVTQFVRACRREINFHASTEVFMTYIQQWRTAKKK